VRARHRHDDRRFADLQAASSVRHGDTGFRPLFGDLLADLRIWATAISA